MTVTAEPEIVVSGNAPAPGVVVTSAVAQPVAFDVEKQQQPAASAAPTYASAAPALIDTEAGKGMGIALFVVILVGLVFLWIFPLISFICIITAIVLSSILTCSCCCAADYNLQPHVKKFAVATLVSLVLIFIIQVIYLIALFAAGETSVSGTVSVDTAGPALVIVAVLSLVLNFVALIFSALFTWGRKCCAPRT
ncbi:hypothetical protein ACHAXT_008860 [Thalassiosira profunda]